MSSTPISAFTRGEQRELQSQFRARVNTESPTKYDLDFYRRKLARLEDDSNALQDELNRARVRLRRAQDFELKYELILKQNSNLLADMDRKEKELCQKKSQNQHLRASIEQKTGKTEDWSKQRLQLQRQIDKWKTKAEQAQEKRISIAIQSRQKAEHGAKTQIQSIKKQTAEREESLQFQIRQLKRQIHQKENIEGVVSARVQKVRSQKDEEIKRLQQTLQRHRATSIEADRQKSEELQRLKQKFEKIFNFQLENLKKGLEDQDQLFSIELNGFREMVGLKNDQISQLLRQIKKQSQQHQYDRQVLSQQVNLLREKIYTIQRQNELEIYNIKQRLTKLHACDIQQLQKRQAQVVNGLKQDKSELEKLLKEKDRAIEGEKKQSDRVRADMLDRLKQRDVRIEHLMERIKQSGDMNDNEMKNLHQSFHQIESEKQLMANDYQTNVGFLNQQYAKLTVTNESLTATVKQLHEEIVRVKREYTQTMQDMERRWKEERKQYEDQRQADRERIERIQQEGRQKERQWKLKEKQLQRLREKEEREKNKLQFIVQQMQRDTQRLNQYIKQLDEALKRELKKNQTSTLDSGGVRRELNAELQRQKSELEAIKRLEVDQIRRKMQIQITRLTNENENLQNGLQSKGIALEKLEEEYKKLEVMSKNIEKINKEKLLEYNKKMATLNNEINLTQNLYKSFLEAKARDQARS